MVNSHYLHGAVEEIEQTMAYAEAQLLESKRQEPGDEEEFTKAQVQLEEANMQLEKMLQSASDDQRDQLYRLQLRLHQLQNRMILGI